MCPARIVTKEELEMKWKLRDDLTTGQLRQAVMELVEANRKLVEANESCIQQITQLLSENSKLRAGGSPTTICKLEVP